MSVGLVRGEKLHFFRLPVVDAAITSIRTHRPIHRIGADAQHVFQLVHKIDGRFAEAIELVNKGKDRNTALLANLEQFFCLRLDALRRVQHHDCAVHRHQRPIRVLAEILMARGIENIDPKSSVIELQHA